MKVRIVRPFTGNQDGPPHVAIATFEPGSGPTLRLTALEYFTDVEATLSQIANDPEKVPTVYVVPAHDSLDEIVLGDAPDRGDADQVCAEWRVGEATLTSRMAKARLAAFPAGAPVLAETQCLATAMRVAQAADLAVLPQTVHLHVSEGRVLCTVYSHETPTALYFEMPVAADRQSYEEAGNFLLGDPLRSWRRNLEKIVLSGGSRYLPGNSGAAWLMDDFVRSAEVVEMPTEGLFTVDFDDRTTLSRFSSQGEHPLFRTNLPVVLAGAAHAFFQNHAADFRRLLPPHPPERISWRDRLAGLFRAGSHPVQGMPLKLPASTATAVTIGLLLAVMLVGVKAVLLYREQGRLERELVVEQRREAANKTIEREVTALSNLIDEINVRITAINRMREHQKTTYDISTNVQWNTPEGLKFSRLTVRGREIAIDGYVTIQTAAAAEGKSPLAVATDSSGNTTGVGIASTIDIADLVGRFHKSLEGSGKYVNIQSRYQRATQEKSTFTITATYQGEIVTDPIALKPLPDLTGRTGSQPTELSKK